MTRRPIVAVLLVAAGCCRGDGSRVPVHPVAGRVEVSNRPAGNARVAFHPVDRERAGGACPVGISRPDGTFTLTTHAAGDGAPAGEYVVTVFWPNESVPMDECDCPDPARHDRLYGLYNDARTSALQATLHPGSNTVTLRPAAGGRGWNLPPLAPRPDAPTRSTRVGADAERERNAGGPASR